MTAHYGTYDLAKLASPDDLPELTPPCTACEDAPAETDGLCETCAANLQSMRENADVADLVRAVREHLKTHPYHVYGLSGIVARFPEMEETGS